MYLVELRPGKEELYRTGDELAAAIRSGEVDGHSRIYHRSSSKWISITLHPQYKAIVSLRAAHQTEGSDWMLAPQAETLEGATEPPGRLDDIVSDSVAADGPEDDQGDNPWRRPIALGISGLFLLFGIQLAYSGPRPQWSTARANAPEIPAAATVISRAESAAAGTRRTPPGPCCSPSRSDASVEAVANTGTGRVCGTAAGIAPRLIHSTTPSLRASSRTSSPSCFHL